MDIGNGSPEVFFHSGNLDTTADDLFVFDMDRDNYTFKD